MADGSTSVTRVFIAHGFGYNLSLLGGKAPVEDDSVLEKVMQGFEFTAPPETQPASSSEHGKALNISQRMGQIAGWCIMGAVLLFLVRRAGKRKTGNSSRGAGA